MIVDAPSSLKPLVFGEVLFDQFEDSRCTLGGAPFNVACHLQGFGLNPFFISKIGDDEHGMQVRRTMQGWGMEIAGLQVDTNLSTGIVHVALQDSLPSFEIPPGQAWDEIEYPDGIQSITQDGPPLLYHGSLALRSRKNQETLRVLREDMNPYIFADLNLRAPWWDRAAIQQIIQNVSAIKLSLEELNAVLERHSSSSFQESLEPARKLCDIYNLQFIIVTMGGDGAALLEPGGKATCFDSVAVQSMQDTVGAGDAFSSVVILGILKEWELEDTMNRASEFAARICSVRGAVPFNEELYQGFLEKW